MSESSNKKRKKDDDVDRADSSSSSCQKKLRYTEPDLRVIIKCKEDDEEDESSSSSAAATGRVYNMYGQNLARLSNFVDASLSIDMKERNTMEIVFRGITPKLFEKALKFLQDPISIRIMEPRDALELIPFYDKYQFTSGLVLCDEILSEFITSGQQQTQSSTSSSTSRNSNNKPPPAQDLDLLVQSCAFAYKFDLTKSRPKCVAYLNSKFQQTDTGGGSIALGTTSTSATMFTEDHLRLIQPMFLDGSLTLPPGFSREDLTSNMFPKYFIKCMACEFATRMTQNITLSGTGTHDGKFRKEGGAFIAPFRQEVIQLKCGQQFDAYFSIRKLAQTNGDWAIVCTRVEGGDQRPHVLWKSPYSQNLTLPPTEPWYPVDIMRVDRKPKIRYN